jgi:hypothetical protein
MRNFGFGPLLLLESTFRLLTKSKQIGKVIGLIARKMNVQRVGSFQTIFVFKRNVYSLVYRLLS